MAKTKEDKTFDLMPELRLKLTVQLSAAIIASDVDASMSFEGVASEADGQLRAILDQLFGKEVDGS